MDINHAQLEAENNPLGENLCQLKRETNSKHNSLKKIIFLMNFKLIFRCFTVSC